jgi:hypothetical protein
MKRVTRNIDPLDARDLLQRVPRACLSFAGDQGAQAQPVVLVWRDGRHLVGVPADADRLPGAGQEVSLLVDEGVHFFGLRAICIRGRVSPGEAPTDAPDGRAWFELAPLRTVAWDYGTLRETRDEG